MVVPVLRYGKAGGGHRSEGGFFSAYVLFFASAPLDVNHPALTEEPEFMRRPGRAVVTSRRIRRIHGGAR